MIVKVCEIESLIRGKDKILSTKESALADSFFKKSQSQVNQFVIWGLLKPDTLENPAL